VKSGATSSSQDKSVSFEVILSVTQGRDQVVEQNVDNDDEDQGQAMGDVQESITVGRTRRNSCKPSWITTNMIVAYALQSLRRQSRLHINKLKSVRSSRCGRMP